MISPDRKDGKRLVTDHPGFKNNKDRLRRDPNAPVPMETDPSRFTNMDDELQNLLIEERTKALVEEGLSPEWARQQAEHEQR